MVHGVEVNQSTTIFEPHSEKPLSPRPDTSVALPGLGELGGISPYLWYRVHEGLAAQRVCRVCTVVSQIMHLILMMKFVELNKEDREMQGDVCL